MSSAAIDDAPTGQPTTLGIDGMHCAACVRRVERALVKVDGIVEANADFINGQGADSQRRAA